MSINEQLKEMLATSDMKVDDLAAVIQEYRRVNDKPGGYGVLDQHTSKAARERRLWLKLANLLRKIQVWF